MKYLKNILFYKIAVWVILLFWGLLGIFWMRGYISGSTGSDKTVSMSSAVTYIEQVEEVVFLNVGIERVVPDSEQNKIFNYEIPLSKKTALIILRYQAKLGIKKSVDIEVVGNSTYKVIVPKFEIIGIDLDQKKPYELYDKSGELLSYSTKDVDTGKLVTDGLSSKQQAKYLEKYKENLKASAEDYYTNIIRAIDPDAEVTVTFK